MTAETCLRFIFARDIHGSRLQLMKSGYAVLLVALQFPFDPVFPEQLHRVRRSDGAVPAA